MRFWVVGAVGDEIKKEKKNGFQKVLVVFEVET